MTARFTLITAAIAAAALASPAAAGPLATFTASGADAAAIAATVEDFRNALGDLNAPDGVNHPDGRRQINWDAAPDAISDPNTFPGDFFNQDFFPRARGVTFTTDGSEMRLSSTATSGTPVEFGEDAEFDTFSAERLFGVFDGTYVDVFFRNPANPAEQALSDGFGAVFTGNELTGMTHLEFFDINDNSLIKVDAPFAGDEGLSFVGVTFTDFEVARVRVTAGNVGVNNCAMEGIGSPADCVAMDDFIFGEPQAVAEPGALALAAGGLAAVGLMRRRA